MGNSWRETVVRVLAAKGGVWAVYAFGSQVQGQSHERSDYDVAVVAQRPVPLDFLLTGQGELEQRLKAKVDVVDLRRMDPFLALEILQGEHLWVKNPAEADEFELYILRRAGDLAPFERERRSVLVWGKKP